MDYSTFRIIDLHNSSTNWEICFFFLAYCKIRVFSPRAKKRGFRSNGKKGSPKGAPREKALAEPAEEPDHHQAEGNARQGDVLDLIRHRAVQVKVPENRNQVGH